MAKALYWAIKHCQDQPSSIREWADEEDVKALLDAKFSSFAAGFKVGNEAALKLVREAAAAGDHVPDLDKLVTFLTPPDLQCDARFIEDGGAPPRGVDHDKNRRDLAETTRQTIAAFGLGPAAAEAKRIDDDRHARSTAIGMLR